MATLFLFTVNAVGLAQDNTAAEEAPVMGDMSPVIMEYVDTSVQTVAFSVDMVWILVAGFLVFWMQAGFAFLNRARSVRTQLLTPWQRIFFEATMTALIFFAVGFGIAYGKSVGGLFGTSLFFLDGADGTAGTQEEARLFLDAFYQFAFAAAAGTIITGATAERVNFISKIIYSGIVALVIAPVFVHWISNASKSGYS